MKKLIAVLGLSVAEAIGQTCIEYGKPTVLAGSLVFEDEAGYNQFIALRRLARPICTRPDPGERSVREIQAGVYGNDSASETLRERLDRLVGHRVRAGGVLFHAETGYHRTNVQLSVESVDAVDAAGQRALLVQKPKFEARNMSAYDVTIYAGPRLVIEATRNRINKANSLRP